MRHTCLRLGRRRQPPRFRGSRRVPAEGSHVGRRRLLQVLQHPLKDISPGKKVVIFGLPGAFTGVCSAQHVPSYKNNIDKFKAKGIDSVICVAVNDPYVMNGWTEKLQAKEAIEFYGAVDGKFHKSMELDLDLSDALLGHRSQRWSAYVLDGKIQVLNVEKVPSDSSFLVER